MPAKKDAEAYPTSIRFPKPLKTWMEGHAREKGWYVSFLVIEVMRQYKAHIDNNKRAMRASDLKK